MRNMKRAKYFFLAALLAAGGTASAADLKECLGLAAANSPALRAYEQKLSGALAANDKDRRSLYPQLSLSGEEGYSAYSGEAGLKNGITGSAGFEFAWDLPKALAGYPALSRIEADKAGVLLEQAKKELERDVKRDYYKLYILESKQADYAAAREYFDSHIKDIKRLEDQGLDLKLDLIRAGMQLKALATTEAGIQAEFENVLLSLNSASGGNFKREDFKFEDLPAPGLIEASAGAADGALLATRLDELDLAGTREAWRQSAWGYAPTVALGTRKSLSPIDPAAELKRTYLTINLPVFDFGQRAAERKTLQREAEAQQSLAMENNRRLKLSIKQLRGEVKNAAAACAAASSGLVDADKIIETAKAYYRQGKIKETDLLSVFSEYLDAKQRARDALDNYLDKKAGLDYLLAGSAR